MEHNTDTFDPDEKSDMDENSEAALKEPFDSKNIKVTMQPVALSSLINRLKHEEIDLQPNFQRNADLWTKTQMSRLIESILLKMPLPIFYFDVENPDKWLVVDGLQRLSTIKRFAVDKNLTLTNLEFLTDLQGKGFDDLDRPSQRVIEEAPMATYQIEPQTPKEVRYSIFNRINTGGLKLNAQEIRQALNQKGIAVKFLRQQVATDVFKKVVAIKTERMLDHELALRFFSFKLLDIDDNFKTLPVFLDRAIEKIDQSKSVTKELCFLSEEFCRVLILSESVLGGRP